MRDPSSTYRQNQEIIPIQYRVNFTGDHCEKILHTRVKNVSLGKIYVYAKTKGYCVIHVKELLN